MLHLLLGKNDRGAKRFPRSDGGVQVDVVSSVGQCPEDGVRKLLPVFFRFVIPSCWDSNRSL